MASEKDNKSFSFDVMAAVFAVLQKKNVSFGKKDLELMEDLMEGLDAKRTASSLDHAFRPVKHRAKELLEKDGAEDDVKTSAKKPKPSKGAKVGPSGGATKSGSKKPSKNKRVDEGNAERSDGESTAKRVKQETPEGNSFFTNAWGDLA
ncbi:hypothetical protein KC316_g9104 [Hortaea werneckii]|nr:hypothetical protein KC324_g9097 [Hortaea werneckii]KAI7580167.1 hypothetical protein KC316_g9104 [Hortaea werneckii]